MDISNAFLNGFFQEVVFMVQPKGFVNPQLSQHVCKLTKALHGFKQAPRAWFDHLQGTLLNWGFVSSKSDVLLFIYKTGRVLILVLVYVDDILITDNKSTAITKLVTDLHRIFALKDLGSLHYFLGIEAFRDTTGLYLSQSKYVADLLKKT